MARRGEDLYEKHARSVYRYLFSLSGEPDTAEDLTQETFCQALKSLDTFRGDCTPQVWLCAIAKRLWYKELEHRSRTAPLEEEHLSSLTAPDNPEGEAERREDRMAACCAFPNFLQQHMEVMPADCFLRRHRQKITVAAFFHTERNMEIELQLLPVVFFQKISGMFHCPVPIPSQIPHIIC